MSAVAVAVQPHVWLCVWILAIAQCHTKQAIESNWNELNCIELNMTKSFTHTYIPRQTREWAREIEIETIYGTIQNVCFFVAKNYKKMEIGNKCAYVCGWVTRGEDQYTWITMQTLWVCVCDLPSPCLVRRSEFANKQTDLTFPIRERGELHKCHIDVLWAKPSQWASERAKLTCAPSW